jgi:uncharacterized protein YacL
MEKTPARKWRYIFLLMAACSFTTWSNAQSKASCNVFATVSQAIGAKKMEDLDFGEFPLPKSLSMTVMSTRRFTPTLPPLVANVNNVNAVAAEFEITHTNASFAISASETIVNLKRKGGKDKMLLQLTTSVTDTQTNINKTRIIVDGTLFIGRDQHAGIYNADEPFSITIHYN